MRRQIIKIDEDLCTGCGLCVPSCAEGALEVVDGKVRVVSEIYCDGLGACLGECPEGALSLEEREAPEFDEDAVQARLGEIHPAASDGDAAAGSTSPGVAAPTFACPGSLSRLVREAPGEEAGGAGGVVERDSQSLLVNWPVQLALVNPRAEFLRGTDLLIAADCAPFAYRLFHEDYLEGRSVVVGCPKLDDRDLYLEKLVALFREAQPKSVTVVHMEVPCCFGLVGLVHDAVARSGLKTPVEEAVITVAGASMRKGDASSAR